MRILFDYLRRWKQLVFAALLLATVNQVFSLLDPQVFRVIVLYVLAKGLIVELGTHDSLLGTSGLYAALWREQRARREA
jgi:ATP-binding cassette, subfamily B, bacterial